MNNVLAYQLTKKSKGVAYLLGAFLGGVGVHRLYLGDVAGGVAYLALFVLGIVFPPIVIITCFYLLFDLFYTSRLCDDVNKKLYQSIKSGEINL